MSKKKITAIGLIILFAIFINVYIFAKVKPDMKVATETISISMSSNQTMGVQIFYSDDLNFQADQMEAYEYKKALEQVDISAPVNINTKYVRIDFGDIANQVTIYSAKLKVADKEFEIDLSKFEKPELDSCINDIKKSNQAISIDAADVDPYVVIALDDVDTKALYEQYYSHRYFIYDILLCVVVDVICALCIVYLRKLVRVPLELYRDRKMVWNLSKNDFQAKFVGSYLGVIWAFVQPVILMLLYWFVFQVGLRAGNVSDYPFILYLMTGMIPWFYFSEALNGGTSALTEYSYLVKKVVFDIDILPVIKVISSVFVHLFFVVVIVVISAIYGYGPDLYLIQLIYYILCTCFLLVGLSYINSACMVFFKDTAQVINIVLTIGVWITPIMWNPEGIISPKLQVLFKINPFYYIVDGFRDAILAKTWFWDKPVWTIYFWCITILIYIAGVGIFSRLKPHFSDVL